MIPAARFFQTITQDTFTKKLVILGISQVFFTDFKCWESNCELDFSLLNFLKVTSTSLPSGTRKIKLLCIPVNHRITEKLSSFGFVSRFGYFVTIWVRKGFRFEGFTFSLRIWCFLVHKMKNEYFWAQWYKNQRICSENLHVPK